MRGEEPAGGGLGKVVTGPARGWPIHVWIRKKKCCQKTKETKNGQAGDLFLFVF